MYSRRNRQPTLSASHSAYRSKKATTFFMMHLLVRSSIPGCLYRSLNRAKINARMHTSCLKLKRLPGFCGARVCRRGCPTGREWSWHELDRPLAHQEGLAVEFERDDRLAAVDVAVDLVELGVDGEEFETDDADETVGGEGLEEEGDLVRLDVDGELELDDVVEVIGKRVWWGGSGGGFRVTATVGSGKPPVGRVPPG